MTSSFSECDRAAMRRALELAALGLETTDPNPRVGCTIAKNGVIIAEGWHERAGGPHAEVDALRKARTAVDGATAYVTLEPCVHHGRTPPCVNALIEARIARVVFAASDPDPRVAGRGSKALSEAGIQVEGGLFAAESEALNEGYMKRHRTGRPFVRVKVAASLDGRTALANGESRWITSEAARQDVQRWRARSSAILTGVQTVLTDNPQLNVRGEGRWRQPLRVVLDSSLRTPPKARIFGSEGDVLIFTVREPAGFAARNARVEQVPGGPRVSLPHVLDRLGQRGVNELLVEAGPTLSGAFLKESLADELLLYIAPVLLGQDARPLMELPALARLQDAARLAVVEMAQTGEDVRLRLRPH